MKSYAAVVVAAFLGMTSALPAADATASECIPETTTSSCTTIVSTVLATNVASVLATLTSATATTTQLAGSNVQKFTGTLGGAPPPVISSTGDRPFSVNGDTFVGIGAAVGRSCDVQHNACANAANSGSLSGGVSQCDTQNTACHTANNLKKRSQMVRDQRPTLPKRAALDLGSCSNANILFEAGLDGRNTDAFIAANQQDFNHGSALNIAVIAGFICQRLGSPCNAPSAVQSSCAQASSAAVAATQDQSAADAWNAIMGDGSVGVAASAAAAAAPNTAVVAPTAVASECVEETATPTSDAVVMTITSCV